MKPKVNHKDILNKKHANMPLDVKAHNFILKYDAKLIKLMEKYNFSEKESHHFLDIIIEGLKEKEGKEVIESINIIDSFLSKYDLNRKMKNIFFVGLVDFVVKDINIKEKTTFLALMLNIYLYKHKLFAEVKKELTLTHLKNLNENILKLNYSIVKVFGEEKLDDLLFLILRNYRLINFSDDLNIRAIRSLFDAASFRALVKEGIYHKLNRILKQTFRIFNVKFYKETILSDDEFIRNVFNLLYSKYSVSRFETETDGYVLMFHSLLRNIFNYTHGYKFGNLTLILDLFFKNNPVTFFNGFSEMLKLLKDNSETYISSESTFDRFYPNGMEYMFGSYIDYCDDVFQFILSASTKRTYNSKELIFNPSSLNDWNALNYIIKNSGIYLQTNLEFLRHLVDAELNIYDVVYNINIYLSQHKKSTTTSTIGGYDFNRLFEIVYDGRAKK